MGNLNSWFSQLRWALFGLHGKRQGSVWIQRTSCRQDKVQGYKRSYLWTPKTLFTWEVLIWRLGIDAAPPLPEGQLPSIVRKRRRKSSSTKKTLAKKIKVKRESWLWFSLWVYKLSQRFFDLQLLLLHFFETNCATQIGNTDTHVKLCVWNLKFQVSPKQWIVYLELTSSGANYPFLCGTLHNGCATTWKLLLIFYDSSIFDLGHWRFQFFPKCALLC